MDDNLLRKRKGYGVFPFLRGLLAGGRKVRRSIDELEMIIDERTEDLIRLNERLCADIAERRQAEESLRETQRLLCNVLDAIPDLFRVLDRDLKVVHSNWRPSKPGITMDIRQGEIHCADPGSAGQAGGCGTCHALEVFRTGKPVFREKHHPSWGHVEIRDFPILDDSGAVVMVAEHIRDINERKVMENELFRTQKLESLGVLAGGIAHDFNNLLTGIMGNISLARTYSMPGDRISVRLEQAEKAAMRAKDLTHQLLTFSKGGAPIRKPISLTPVIRDAAGFVLRGANVRCEFSLPDSLWPVEADLGQISQVISNLVINAYQAMPGGGVIDVSAENVSIGDEDFIPLLSGKYVHLTVSDQGIGIPEENLGKIFDPYFTTREKGNGLGLSTVYSILRNHDGYIGVESAVGKGTVFHVYLPASEEMPAEAVPVRKVKTPVNGSGLILVMDDEEQIRDLACEMLWHLGYQTECCEDGAAAIEMYRAAKEAGKSYNAIIMDLTIPGGMGGKEAMRNLHKLDPSLKGIVSSGYSDDPIIARYREYGFSGVVSKPYTLDELRETLQSIL